MADFEIRIRPLDFSFYNFMLKIYQILNDSQKNHTNIYSGSGKLKKNPLRIPKIHRKSHSFHVGKMKKQLQKVLSQNFQDYSHIHLKWLAKIHRFFIPSFSNNLIEFHFIYVTSKLKINIILISDVLTIFWISPFKRNQVKKPLSREH